MPYSFLLEQIKTKYLLPMSSFDMLHSLHGKVAFPTAEINPPTPWDAGVSPQKYFILILFQLNCN